MTVTAELAIREERAQGGIIQFAQELQAIRDGKLYPGAGTNSGDPWGSYCKDRWSLSRSRIDNIIRALPVLLRFAADSAANVTVEKAAVVATLPDPVQDAILNDQGGQIHEDDVKAKAKAARKARRDAENEGRAATVDELIDAAATVRPRKPKKRSRKFSKFTRHLEAAYHEVQQSADYAQGDVLSDTENDFAWNRVAKIRYELERIEDKLYQPETIKDVEAEFAELLGGEER